MQEDYEIRADKSWEQDRNNNNIVQKLLAGDLRLATLENNEKKI